MHTDVATPTFLIIGAQKCGTTWLAEVLRQHPQVFLSVPKEIHYYDDWTRYARGADWYLDHFRGSRDATAVGEATPNYLWTRATELERRLHHVNTDMPAKIHADFPGLRLVVCLRDPADRAVSAYFHSIHSRYVAPSQGILDVAHTFGIESAGRYAASLQDWLAVWPRDRFEFVVYEDDIRDGDKRATVDRVCASLGIDPLPRAVDVTGTYNVRPGSTFLRLHHRSPLAARAVRRLHRGFERWEALPIEVSAEERAELRARFRDEIAPLEELIGRDLSSWPTAGG